MKFQCRGKLIVSLVSAHASLGVLAHSSHVLTCVGDIMLTEDEIEIIRSSAEKMAELNVAATNLFYANLFKEVPEIRGLFPDEMFDQSEKLWASIVMVVESVDDLTEIVPALRELGARHVAYGAEPEHYKIVGRVLIETIASLMPTEWTEFHQDTWTKAMTVVAETMLAGASQRAA